MGERIHVLARQLLGKSSLQHCTVEEIQALVDQYPYFAPARFLLLEKMKEVQDERYTAQLQKSVLYYHNPVAFEYFIASDKFHTEIDSLEIEDGIHQHDPGHQESGSSQAPEEEYQHIDEQENVQHPDDTEEEIDGKPVSTQTEPGDGDEGNAVKQNSVINQHPVSGKGGREPEAQGSETSVSSGLQEPSLMPETDQDGEGSKAEMPSLQIRQPENGEAPLSFEPYHTVDYFASQGIKLSQEELPKDKFGRQLKSFTEWLRTMKKIPSQDTVADPAGEQKVLHMAEDSVHQAHIRTEAMAEVWLKQGNNQKALEIYQQLSLLNPSKKAYFAALIEKIKQS